jgi:hypothetical protein
MSQRTLSTDSVASALPDRDSPGVSLVPPESGGQLTLDTPTVRDIGPRFTEWLPDAHEALLPAISRAARALAFQYDPQILNDHRPRLFAHECLHRKHGVGTSPDRETPAHPFNDALAKFAISYYDVDPDDLSDRKRELYDYAGDEILQTGTRDLPGAPTGLDALRETTIPLLDAADSTPSLVVSFDDTAWMDVDDQRTAARALDVLSALGEAVDVRLVLSPSLDAHLERAHPDWYDDHLTESGDEHRRPAPFEASESALSSAWEVVGGFTPNGGRLRLLAALDPDGEREVRDLKADAEIDLSDGAIDRYVRELADEHDLATIDDRPKYNQISLTRTGSASQTLIGPEYGVIHPAQSRLNGRLTGTPHDSTSVVCRTDREDGPPQPADGGGGGAGGASAASSPPSSSSSTQDSSSRSSGSLADAPRTAEDWLADTGDASEDGYAQWLDGPDGRLDAWEMHERLLAGRRVEGVTLVDEPIKPFDDGRATYKTCFNDEAQAVVQWGGPLCTLVRVTSTLLSEDMWSKVLTPSAIGSDLEELYDGALDDAIQDVLRLGAQVGWFGEEQRDYDGLRDRLGEIRRLILSKLPEAMTDSSDEWGELCRDAHGLLASATHLYRAAGVDVTIHIRVPDTQKLRKGDERYGKFLDFFKHTVPKNAAYGVHSVYRLLHEKRVDKLKHRMGVEFDDDPTADLTASWVVSGPTATTFRDDVEQAIASKADDVREQIQDGNEQGVSLSVPVVEGNGHGALRRVVERIADRKGFTDTSTLTLRQLTRLSAATLGEQPGRCSPYALAEALLKIAKARSSNASLSPSDVAAGLATLPAERLLPELPPTMRRVFKTLVASDRPLGRSTIIERAGISENSYGRNLDELAAFDLVESVGNGGHKKWNAWILPWWSPLADVEAPRTADTDENDVTPPSRVDDVLYQAALDLGLDPEYNLFATPVDVDAVFAALPDLNRWRGFIVDQYGLDVGDSVIPGRPFDQHSGSDTIDSASTHAAQVGLPPADCDYEQTSIEAAS